MSVMGVANGVDEITYDPGWPIFRAPRRSHALRPAQYTKPHQSMLGWHRGRRGGDDWRWVSNGSRRRIRDGCTPRGQLETADEPCWMPLRERSVLGAFNFFVASVHTIYTRLSDGEAPGRPGDARVPVDAEAAGLEAQAQDAGRHD